MDRLYSFVYRGILAEAALDKVGRRRRRQFGPRDAEQMRAALSYEILDAEFMATAQRMGVVYSAIHAFENSVRHLVTRAMAEQLGEDWWSSIPAKIQKRVQTRSDEDAKFRWHGARGGSQINYCDFGDLSSIINFNWGVFENVLADLEWAKAILGTLEKSRNIVMHGGELANVDIERIGMNIRDWIRQTG